MRNPILRPWKEYVDHGQTYRIRAEGGLHMMKGNAKPYFSLTHTTERKERGHWCEDSGGAGHDEILRHWPELADLAALHLSDIDGVPMHGEANAWYWLAGACGGLGEKYHGGNRETYGKPANCDGILAEHLRITMEDVRQLCTTIRAMAGGRREWFRNYVNCQRPRWKEEAEACIAHHGLQVYGDAPPTT